MTLLAKLNAAFLFVVAVVATVSFFTLGSDLKIVERLDQLMKHNIEEIASASDVAMQVQRVKTGMRELLLESTVEHGTHAEIERSRKLIEESLVALESAARKWEGAIKSDLGSAEKVDDDDSQTSSRKGTAADLARAEADEMREFEEIFAAMVIFTRATTHFLDLASNPHISNTEKFIHFETKVEPVSRDLQHAIERLLLDTVAEAQDEGAVFEKSLYDNLILSIVSVVFSLLVAVALAAFLSRRISGPILRLTEVSASVASGKMDASALSSLPQSRDEVGVLITTFQTMVDRLRNTQNELKTLSATDSLTGLANRRHLDEMLAGECARAKRGGEPLAVVMIDADHFKPFNDEYGHQAGDECLKDLAEVLARYARRAGDMAARYGGEEFTLVLPATDGAHARRQAEELRQDVERLAIPHVGSPTGCVTVSIGVAVAEPGMDLEPAELIERADAALYTAKEGGRNRVEMAPPGLPRSQ